MSTREPDQVRLLVDELRRVIGKHGLDAEIALASLIQVVAEQLAAYVMSDALAASGTALSREAVLQRVEDERDRFWSGVLSNINAGLQRWPGGGR